MSETTVLDAPTSEAVEESQPEIHGPIPMPESKLDHNAVVAIYKTHHEAEDAIRKLQEAGFNMKKLSIVGQDYHTEEDVVGYYNVGDRMMNWGATGAFWGGIWGLLFGSAFFVLPGVGPILAAGPLVVWIVGALETAALVGGVSALSAALFSIGIPKDAVIEYETQVKAGKFLVIARDTRDNLEEARGILNASAHEGVSEFSW